MDRFKRFGRVMRDALKLSYATQLTFGAASITYYLLVSLVPLSLLSFIALSVFGGENVATYVIVQAEQFLTPAGYTVIEEVLTQTAGRGSATALGIVFLSWTLYEIFHSFDIAIARIQCRTYQSSVKELLTNIGIALVMVSGGIILITAVNAVLGQMVRSPFLGVVGLLTQFALLTVVFLSLYYQFSDEPYRLGDLLPGAVFAAIGWTVLQLVFSSYIAVKIQFIGAPIYELFEGLLFFIVWLYAASSTLLFGVAINTVRSPGLETALSRKPKNTDDM